MKNLTTTKEKSIDEKNKNNLFSNKAFKPFDNSKNVTNN
jgi:hypothetical protein